MDNFQFWLYVIVAIIYVLSRALKKKAPEPGDTPQQQPGRPSTGTGRPRQPSFEELLREITEAKKESSRPRQATPPSYKPPVTRTLPPPKPAYVDYDDNLPEEEQDLEDTNYDYRTKDRVYDVYEEAKKQAFVSHSYEDETEKPESVLKFGKFEEFGIRRKRATVLDRYVADLKKPGGFKRAVVLSEILNRKY